METGDGIAYNHLNLPQQITTPQGTITYTYDAAGNKIKKVVAETDKGPKITLYLSGAVYENDTLQFLAHEEGRIRTRTPNRLDTLYYDYFLKDHLGNVRMVLTEEVRQDGYPAATMETASATTEEAVYANLSQTRVDKPAGYPYDPYLDPNGKVAKAYLNWVVLDEAQFKLVEGNYGATQVPLISGTMEKQVLQAAGGASVEVKKNGYLYVYLSNESKGAVYSRGVAGVAGLCRSLPENAIADVTDYQKCVLPR